MNLVYLGAVASMNCMMSQWYSDCRLQEIKGQELIDVLTICLGKYTYIEMCSESTTELGKTSSSWNSAIFYSELFLCLGNLVRKYREINKCFPDQVFS